MLRCRSFKEARRCARKLSAEYRGAKTGGAAGRGTIKGSGRGGRFAARRRVAKNGKGVCGVCVCVCGGGGGGGVLNRAGSWVLFCSRGGCSRGADGAAVAASAGGAAAAGPRAAPPPSRAVPGGAWMSCVAAAFELLAGLLEAQPHVLRIPLHEAARGGGGGGGALTDNVTGGHRLVRRESPRQH